MVGGKSRDSKDQRIVEALLKELRINSGMRQVDVAAVLGVQQSIVSKYEVGERRLDILEVRHLCKMFGIPLVDFIKELEIRLEGKNEAD